MHLDEGALYRLSGKRRRWVSISQLACVLAEVETGAEAFDPDTGDYERFYVDIYQSDIPTRSEYDVGD